MNDRELFGMFQEMFEKIIGMKQNIAPKSAVSKMDIKLEKQHKKFNGRHPRKLITS